MLREIFLDKIGSKALLYTTDGASASLLRCGFVPGAYATVDFGTTANVTSSFQTMRLYQPKVSKPRANSLSVCPGSRDALGYLFLHLDSSRLTRLFFHALVSRFHRVTFIHEIRSRYRAGSIGEFRVLSGMADSLGRSLSKSENRSRYKDVERDARPRSFR